jgi:hypothetical protein
MEHCILDLAAKSRVLPALDGDYLLTAHVSLSFSLPYDAITLVTPTVVKDLNLDLFSH